MGGKGSDTPAAPDYAALAEAQALSSREVTEQQTWANRPTQITPFGRQDWYQTPVWDPATGQYLNRWTQTTNLHPDSQRALDAQLEQKAVKGELASSMLGRLGDEYGQAMDWTGFEDLQRGPDAYKIDQQRFQSDLDYGQLGQLGGSQDYVSDAEGSIYDKGASRLDRRTDEGRESLRTSLVNQGLSQGDESYDRAMQDFEEGATDAYGQLSMDAIIGGGAEAQRMFGMDVSRRGQLAGEIERGGAFSNQAAKDRLNQQLAIADSEFGQGMQQAGFMNTLRQQQIAEAMQQRGFTLNEINAIMSGSQVAMPGMPGFEAAGRSESTQFLEAGQMQEQSALDRASLDQAADQAQMEAITGLGGAAFGMSDRRLKKNVKKRGRHPNGLQIYSFSYIWDSIKRFGFMADEVKKVFPSAVSRHSSGYDMVDYGELKCL